MGRSKRTKLERFVDELPLYSKVKLDQFKSDSGTVQWDELQEFLSRIPQDNSALDKLALKSPNLVQNLLDWVGGIEAMLRTRKLGSPKELPLDMLLMDLGPRTTPVTKRRRRHG